MTNFEKIRQMSDEELAKLITDNVINCSFCNKKNGKCSIDDDCFKNRKAWLNSEVEE